MTETESSEMDWVTVLDGTPWSLMIRGYTIPHTAATHLSPRTSRHGDGQRRRLAKEGGATVRNQALREAGYHGWLTIERFGFSIGEISAAAAIWRDIERMPDTIA